MKQAYAIVDNHAVTRSCAKRRYEPFRREEPGCPSLILSCCWRVINPLLTYLLTIQYIQYEFNDKTDITQFYKMMYSECKVNKKVKIAICDAKRYIGTGCVN